MSYYVCIMENTDNKNEIVFSMSPGACLSEKVSDFFTHPQAKESNLTHEDFHQYGRTADGQFLPYWRDIESFDDFIQREVGLDRKHDEVVREAVDAFFFGDNVPQSADHTQAIAGLSVLFTPDEVSTIQAHAIMVEDENWYNLALAFQSTGQLPPGSVQKFESPLIKLYSEADPEIAEFYEEVRSEADALYGVPKYYPEPEANPDIVNQYRHQDVIYSEPQIRTVGKDNIPVWSATIQGEAHEAKNRIPVFSLEETVDLVVLDQTKDLRLTDSLLKKTQLIRYWIGAKIMDLQRKKVKDLKRVFSMVSYRKPMDAEGKLWRFAEPAKKP